MDVSDGMMKSGLKMAIDYIGKDPDVNMGRLMDWVDRIAGRTGKLRAAEKSLPENTGGTGQQHVPASEKSVDGH